MKYIGCKYFHDVQYVLMRLSQTSADFVARLGHWDAVQDGPKGSNPRVLPSDCLIKCE